jgi:UPF0755 protein
VRTPFIPSSIGKPVALFIQPGESTQAIAEDLSTKGLISNALAFRLWARIRGLDTHLQAGAYTLAPGMSMEQIIAKLQQGQPDEKRLVIIEGWRLEQIGAQLQTLALPNFHEQDFVRLTHHPQQLPDYTRYPLLKQALTMEGQLFPDTYLIPLNYNAAQIIDLLLAKGEQVMQRYHLIVQAEQHRLTAYQMLILASIVQREAANKGQMPLIAGIYWKRIFQPNPEIGALLEADPTVQYARDTDHPPASASGYWKPLTDVGGKIDPESPWNTYNAPQQTDCYFFLTRPADGRLICAATYAAFQQLEKQYLP